MNEAWILNNKSAIIQKSSQGYEINFYNDEHQKSFVARCSYSNKSIYYVRDAAENWINNIFKIKDVKRHEKA